MAPRFRFAPSPTGVPHLGNLHTALFSWALARSVNGEFLLRIEDSDRERNLPDAVPMLLDSLAWLGLDWDEGPDVGGDYGPYYQSQRIGSHKQAIERLLELDQAYYGESGKASSPSQNEPLRLRMPSTGRTILRDAIRGEISFDNKHLRDPIIVRSDGRPLYHLASTVDDHDMGVTHVVRAEEWISSSPYHVQLYRALGWPEPVWVHLPLILNKEGQKLKKRDPEGGYQVDDLRDAGYVPEAVFNYLLLLGWAPDGDEEILTRRELVSQIRLERLSPSPAVFDWDKMNWVNRQHLQQLSTGSLARRVRPFLEEYYELPMSEDWLVSAVSVIREEMTTLGDAVNLLEWALADEIEYTEEGKSAIGTQSARHLFTRLIAELASVVLLDRETAKSILQSLRASFGKNHGWNSSGVYKTIRAALVGHVSGPPTHEIMGVLGKERTLQRVAAALRR